MAFFQVASKTNDVAGDGTTSATVLTRAIFREGCKVLVVTYVTTLVSASLRRCFRTSFLTLANVGVDDVLGALLLLAPVALVRFLQLCTFYKRNFFGYCNF